MFVSGRGGCREAAADGFFEDDRGLHSQTRWRRLLPSRDVCCCQSRGLVRTCSPGLGVHVAQEGTDIHPPEAVVSSGSTAVMEIPWIQDGGLSPRACWIPSQDLHKAWLPAGPNVVSITHPLAFLGHYPTGQFLFPKGCSAPKPKSLG